MANLIYDKMLSFGKMVAIASGSFPDMLNLGKKSGTSDHYPDKQSTGVDRMTVDVCFASPAGGASLTVTAQGSPDGSTGWMEVGKNTFTLEQMKAGPCQVAVNPNNFQYLRVNITTTGIGTFTGSAEAFLNTYAGK